MTESDKPVWHSQYDYVVQWGDCDPADIVYYPNFYRWFDNAAHHLFDRAGYPLDLMRKAYQSVGFPLVHAEAEFRSPAKVGDRLTVYTRVARVGSKTLRLEHRIMHGERLCVEGEEIRIMGVRAEGEEQLKAALIPDEIRKALLQN